MSFSLKLFGGVTLTGPAGPVSGAAVQRHRLALLALLALSRSRMLSRDKVMAWLWPERDEERARALLNQAVYALRRELGAEALLTSGDEIQLDPAWVGSDVGEFEDALSEGALERAVGLYGGAFLDGFYLDEAPEFGRWVERERERLAASYARALEGLAEAAEQSGDRTRAVAWWKAMALHQPYDSRVALRLIVAMELAGNRGGALQHALGHIQQLRDDLDLEPAPEVTEAVQRLRGETPVRSTPEKALPETGSVRPAPPGSPRPAPPAVVEPPARESRALRLAVVMMMVVGALLLIWWKANQRADARAPTSASVDEIAQAVARQLARREGRDTTQLLPEYRTRSIPAYELYQRGSDPALLRSDSAARLGLEYYQQAIALDSNYAAAWAGLARMTIRVASAGGLAAERAARSEAEQALNRALTLNDSLAEAHAILGMLRARVYDWESADLHLARAIALEPHRARFREWWVQVYLLEGRPAEAMTEAERAVALEPVSPSANAELARALLANDRCPEALERLRTLEGLTPPLARAAPIAAQCLARLGRWDEAIERLRRPGPVEHPSMTPLLGYLLGRAGRRAEALAVQARLEERWKRGAVSAMDLAFVPTALGDRDQAFDWLNRGLKEGPSSYFPAVGVGLLGPPFLDLADDPRMPALLARMGLQKR